MGICNEGDSRVQVFCWPSLVCAAVMAMKARPRVYRSTKMSFILLLQHLRKKINKFPLNY